jgi:hypothetical protein
MAKAKTAENAILYGEAGQDLVEFAALTDNGDHLNFTSGSDLWSDASGKAPDVRPDGLVSGGVITPAVSGTAELVDVTKATCYLAGVLTTIPAATDLVITRPGTDVYKISSVVVTAAGAFDELEGTDSAGATFSTTRDATGGPKLLVVGTFEVGQVKMTGSATAAILATEIKQVIGTHQERSDYPTFEIDYANGEVDFNSALPLTHTGAIPRAVYAEFYTASFAEVPLASDYKPSMNSHSVSSEQVYGGTVGSVSSSLGSGGFKARLNNGVNDTILLMKDDTRWFKFYPDRLVTTKYWVDQGKVGCSPSYGAGSSMACDVTVAASEKATNIYS